MAIPVMNFQPESFQQANPFLTGMQVGQGLVGQGIQNAYLAPELAAQLQARRLQNQILQPQAQYAPQMTQAQLQNLQAQATINRANAQYANPMALANLQRAQAMPGLLAAQTTATSAQAPLDYARAAQAEQMTRNLQQFPIQQGLAGQLAYANYAAQKYGSTSPEAALANQAVAAGINEQNARAMFFGANAGLKNLPEPVKNQLIAEGYSPGMATPFVNVSPSGAIQFGANPQQMGGVPPSAIGGAMGIGNPASSTVRDIASSAAQKETNTTQVLNQRTYDTIVNNLMTQLQPDMPDIAKFAGLAGAAHQAADKYAASANMLNDPAYIKFNNFKNVTAPIIANEIRRALGGQATDSEQRMMGNLANPVYWNSNPNMALSQMNQLVNVLHANAAALSQSPTGTLNQLRTEPPTRFTNPANQSGMVRIQAPDGRTGLIPQSNLAAALKMGARQVQ